MYNQTETTIINSKSMNISIKYANLEIVIITNHKSMIWSHIYDQNYTLTNIMKFNISPEKHFQHIHLIYYLHMHQIPELYLIQLKQYQLQLFVILKVLFLFILLMILNIYIDVQYILYHMIIKINIIYLKSSQLQVYGWFVVIVAS